MSSRRPRRDNAHLGIFARLLDTMVVTSTFQSFIHLSGYNVLSYYDDKVSKVLKYMTEDSL